MERLVRFAKHAFSTRGTVLIHCEAGISRSTAAALILYAVWLGPGAEREAASRVFQAVAGASPNAAMVRWADQILQREGALIAALVR